MDSFEIEKKYKLKKKYYLQGYLPENKGRELCEMFNMNVEDVIEYRLRRITSGKDKRKSYIFECKSEGKLVRREMKKKLTKELFDKYWKFIESTVEKEIIPVKIFSSGVTLEIEIHQYLDRELVLAEIEYDDFDLLRHLCLEEEDVTDDDSFKNRNLAITKKKE